MNRRGFLTGLTGLIAAPAIIKVAGIMPVKMVDLRVGDVTAGWSWEEIVTPQDLHAGLNEIHWYLKTVYFGPDGFETLDVSLVPRS